MSANVPLYSNSEMCSSVLVIGPQPNSTYDLYLEPRLSEAVKGKVIFHNPFSTTLKDKPVQPDGCLVIINRYVTRDVMRWIEKHRSCLLGVVWLIDDDFSAMTFGRGVPLKNRARPAGTLFYHAQLKRIVDHLIVSTPQLASLYHDWPVTIMPPVVELTPDHRPLDVKQLYYFAKMHGPEHAFLWPIIDKLMSRFPDLKFTVTANGQWAEKWRKVEGVKVVSEIPYETYIHFTQTLECGGIFLVPLMSSRLNASRSDAKLIEVARTASAAVVANHPAYRALGQVDILPETCFTQEGQEDWLWAIEALVAAPALAEQNRQALRSLMVRRYESRQMIL